MQRAPYEPELLLAHAGEVRQLARRLVFDADLAREVEQETWLAALEHAPRHLGNPRAWLSRIARHAAHRLWSRGERRSEHEERAAVERTAERAEGASPPDLLEREQAVRGLLAAVGRLPEPVQRAVVLHHLDGLSLREVARRTQTPLETVRSRTRRGLALLRQDLARNEHGGAGWCLALVDALALTPLRPEPGLLLSARDLLLSSIVMSSTLKLAALTGGIALTLFLGWRWMDRREPLAPDGPALAQVTPSAEAEVTALSTPTQDVDPAPALAERVTAAPPAAPEPDHEPATETARLQAELIWAEDGTRATGVPLRIASMERASGFEPVWHAGTETGLILIEALQPGQYMLESVLGGGSFARVEAGATADVRVAIPEGIRVQGLVRELDGTPVANAEVFLACGGSTRMYEGAVVARSDAGGAFSVRSTPSGRGARLCARAPGRAPTAQVILTAAPRSEVELELIFEGEGRRLTGRVTASNGRPIAGAEVLVGSDYEYRTSSRADGTRTYPPIGQLVETDADGGFEIAGAALEALPIQVQAPGRAPWRGEWGADDAAWREIQLGAGARVSGVVNTADGRPVGGARIRCGTNMQFGGRAAVSAQDGSYSIGPFSSGVHALVVEGEGEKELASLELRPGEQRTWNPMLGGGLLVKGRIEAPGMELGGWTVRGYRGPRAAGEGTYAERVMTDERGRFTLRQAPDAEIDVNLFARGYASAVARVTGVTPGGPEVVLRPEPERLPSAMIRGRLVDESGQPWRSADVWAKNASPAAALVHPDSVDGSFELGPLPPGEWTLTADPLRADWGVTQVNLTLREGEQRDLGAVLVGQGGTLELRIARDPAAEGPLRAAVRDAEGRPVQWLSIAGDRASSRPLAPGDYRLTLPGDAQGEAFRVEAGQVTTLELDARR